MAGPGGEADDTDPGHEARLTGARPASPSRR